MDSVSLYSGSAVSAVTEKIVVDSVSLYSGSAVSAVTEKIVVDSVSLYSGSVNRDGPVSFDTVNVVVDPDGAVEEITGSAVVSFGSISVVPLRVDAVSAVVDNTAGIPTSGYNRT